MKSFTPHPSDITWVERLREGHFIWLCKERCLGQVEIPFYPPEPGTCAGKLALKKFDGNRFVGRTYRGTEVWFISYTGTGFDGSQLILPIEGNLPDFPEPIELPVVMELRREIATLRAQVDNLRASHRDRF